MRKLSLSSAVLSVDYGGDVTLRRCRFSLYLPSVIDCDMIPPKKVDNLTLILIIPEFTSEYGVDRFAPCADD